MYQVVCSEVLKLVDNLPNRDQQKYSKSIAALHPPCFSGLWKGFWTCQFSYGLVWISWVVRKIRQGNTCYSVLSKKCFSTNVFSRLKKLWTICPFYPQNLLKGFSEQSRYSVEFFFFQCSYYYQECEKLTGTLFGNVNASCAMLHYPVNISDHCLSCTNM